MACGCSLVLPSRLVRGFTLIELLVVISITAALISVLLPTISAAREVAAAARCQGNIKQIGFVLLTYCNDYRDQMIPASDSLGTRWSTNIAKDNYLPGLRAGAPTIMACPSLTPNGRGATTGILADQTYGLYSNYPNASFAGKLSKCFSPSDAPWLADTYRSNTDSQTYGFNRPWVSGDPRLVHLRHRDRFNYFCPGGNVRSSGVWAANSSIWLMLDWAPAQQLHWYDSAFTVHNSVNP